VIRPQLAELGRTDHRLADPRQPKIALPRRHQERPLAASQSRRTQPAPAHQPRPRTRRNRLGAELDRPTIANQPAAQVNPHQGSRGTPGKSPSKPLAKIPAHQARPTLGVALFRTFLVVVDGRGRTHCNRLYPQVNSLCLRVLAKTLCVRLQHMDFVHIRGPAEYLLEVTVILGR
jgi:hypothetical protein